MATVELKNIVKYFGQIETLKNISLEIAEGEFVALVGPSGCGKSTLLRTLAGLETLDAGEIIIAGRVVNEVEPKNRDIAMVFQSYALYPQMTVAENMGFALQLKKVEKKIIAKKVQNVATMLDLSHILEHYPRQLSGGQQQRVAMGRAIVREPQVFLFDEPLSNLDAKLRGRMRLELKQLHQRLKTTTIYVTHDQIEAMTLADKVVVLRDGKIEQVGTPLALYDKPANTFVASFIGSPAMNLIKGRILPTRPQYFLTQNGLEIPLQDSPDHPHHLYQRDLILGIRPQDILLLDSTHSHSSKVYIQIIEHMGAESHLLTHFSQTNPMCHIREELFIVSQGRHGARNEDHCFVAFPYQKLHFFDAVTTERITTDEA